VAIMKKLNVGRGQSGMTQMQHDPGGDLRHGAGVQPGKGNPPREHVPQPKAAPITNQPKQPAGPFGTGQKSKGVGCGQGHDGRKRAGSAAKLGRGQSACAPKKMGKGQSAMTPSHHNPDGDKGSIHPYGGVDTFPSGHDSSGNRYQTKGSAPVKGNAPGNPDRTSTSDHDALGKGHGKKKVGKGQMGMPPMGGAMGADPMAQLAAAAPAAAPPLAAERKPLFPGAMSKTKPRKSKPAPKKKPVIPNTAKSKV
jgi:hypothetical protein